MKKFTLLAAAAAVAMSAGAAEFTIADPSVKGVLDKYPNANNFYTILLDEATAEALGATKTVTYIGAEGTYDDEGHLVDGFRPLQIWANFTFSEDVRGKNPEGGTDGMISIDMNANGQAWWGGGFNVDPQGALDLSGITDSYRFHLAYKTQGTAAASTQINILDHAYGENLNGKGSFAIGEDRKDGEAQTPITAIAPKPTDEWQAIDIALSDVKKVFTTFSVEGMDKFSGFTMSFNGGEDNGTNIVLASAYFYNPNEGGQGAIETIEAAEENAAPVYYNLQGVRVANPENGVFIMKAGKEVKKVVL